MVEVKERALGAPRPPPTPPHSLHVAARGRQSRLCGVSGGAAGKQPRRPHSDRHHGGIFTRVSMATAQSLATAAPPGGTRALSPSQVFAAGWDKAEEGARPPSPLPPSSCPPAVLHPRHMARQTDGHTSAQHMYHLLPALGSPGRWGS